ncbi:hypothetical protein G8C92_26695 [Paenibacillus donghaensis]|uniref:hypothetical protein n=1 Tax=Paenibacillus donghaensis TaxID=414771 RepID=UPI0018835A28|nr:hypothetical protein [Paenibacillus donghaensis]MBE9917609.1 hypothetical protein [Paenibacillus donghaensis]
MRKLTSFMGWLLCLAIVAGCGSDQVESAEYGKELNHTSMVITSDGLKWDVDKTAPSFEDTLKQMPFEVKQIKLPFPPTHQAASVIKAPFDMIQLTYADLLYGQQIILVESNSQDDSEPKGKPGPKLQNGTPTWIQSDSQTSALYWKAEGYTYLLMSNKVKNGHFVPLFTPKELAVIASSMK